MKYIFRVVTAILIAFSMLFCTNEKGKYARVKAEKLQRQANLDNLSRHTALPEKVKFPTDNPSTPEKIHLGRLLFFDPILSGNKDVACATCHHPSNGYAEFRDLSIGVNGKGFGSKRVFQQPNQIPFVKRNAHTILNTAFNGINTNNHYQPTEAPMFWDVRSNSLEKQALEPIKAFEEMRGEQYAEEEILEVVIERLKEIPTYQDLFSTAFDGDESINAEHLGQAIAAFERTLVTNHSRFDQYMRGDESAISLSEKEGYALFKEVGCANCHNGPMFSDYKIHVIGVPENEKLAEADSGFEAGFGFRTPTLRNLRFTAPYMHNGSLPNLKRVLEFYQDISMGKKRNEAVGPAHFDPLIRELKLSVKDMAPIISFFNTLNDANFDQTEPETVPSGLAVGGDIR